MTNKSSGTIHYPAGLTLVYSGGLLEHSRNHEVYVNMLSLFKPDPVKKLKKARAQKLEQAMQAQRNGDMRSYASITDEAEKLLQEIQQLQQSNTKKS